MPANRAHFGHLPSHLMHVCLLGLCLLSAPPAAAQVDFLDACSGCEFVVQMWSHVVGLYDYTLLLEYCPYSSLDKLLSIVSGGVRAGDGRGAYGEGA